MERTKEERRKKKGTVKIEHTMAPKNLYASLQKSARPAIERMSQLCKVQKETTVFSAINHHSIVHVNNIFLYYCAVRPKVKNSPLLDKKVKSIPRCFSSDARMYLYLDKDRL